MKIKKGIKSFEFVCDWYCYKIIVKNLIDLLEGMSFYLVRLNSRLMYYDIN